MITVHCKIDNFQEPLTEIVLEMSKYEMVSNKLRLRSGNLLGSLLDFKQRRLNSVKNEKI